MRISLRCTKRDIQSSRQKSKIQSNLWHQTAFADNEGIHTPWKVCVLGRDL